MEPPVVGAPAAGVVVAGGEDGSDGVVFGMFEVSSSIFWLLEMTDKLSFPFCERSHDVNAFCFRVLRVVASTERAGSICKIWMMW